ncbi:hypothetical protein BSKO_03030 [Bryopsis sp. KO-2023]|nr:hypothetical protein BSKO_03030 [Bryopsis sp. KO-2023]
MSNTLALPATWETSSGVRKSRVPWQSSSGDSAETQSSDFSSLSSASGSCGGSVRERSQDRDYVDTPRDRRPCNSCLNGASKVLGLFNKKEHREAQAAMAVIQSRCVKPRTIHSAKERGYRKRQAALYNFIEDAEISGSKRGIKINLEVQSEKANTRTPSGYGSPPSVKSVKSLKDRRVSFWDEANVQFKLAEMQHSLEKGSTTPGSQAQIKRKEKKGSKKNSQKKRGGGAGVLPPCPPPSSPSLGRNSQNASRKSLLYENIEKESGKGGYPQEVDAVVSGDLSETVDDRLSVALANIENAASSRGRSNGVWKGRLSSAASFHGRSPMPKKGELASPKFPHEKKRFPSDGDLNFR